MYREWAPPARLAESVECFWTSRADSALPRRRVLPDGCVDLLFSEAAGEVAVVGTMTSAQVVDVAAGTRIVAVRIRPAMASAMLGLPGTETTDRTMPWSGSRAVSQRLLDARTDSERVAMLASAIPDARADRVVPQMAAWLSRHHGLVRMDDLTRKSGFGARQLRRLFLRDAGVTPKQLARILRFRRATQLAGRGMDWATVAATCGYFDQSHLSWDFREFAGVAPEAWRVSVFSKTHRAAAAYHRGHEDYSDSLRGSD